MRSFYVALLGLLIPFAVHGQGRIRNVQVRVLDSARIDVRYDLLSVQPGDSIYLSVRSRQRGVLRIRPQFIQGSVGMQVSAGMGKRILWNARADGVTLREEIKASVFIKNRLSTPAPAVAPVSKPPKDTTMLVLRQGHKGPAWALLSAVAPGIGNVFVQQPGPKVGLRPLVTVGCYGLVVYGLLEQRKAQENYALYDRQVSSGAGEPIYQLANDQHHRYWLATRGAVVVAAADVLLTFFKGLHNSKLRRASRDGQGILFRPGFQAGQPIAVVSYSF